MNLERTTVGTVLLFQAVLGRSLKATEWLRSSIWVDRSFMRVSMVLVAHVKGIKTASEISY